STRLRRCTATRPGCGDAAASESSAVSTSEFIFAYVFWLARSTPRGGISCVRRLRATFSQTSGFASAGASITALRSSPAVLSDSLWHTTQYCSSTGLTRARLARSTFAAVTEGSVAEAREGAGGTCVAGGSARSHQFAPLPAR